MRYLDWSPLGLTGDPIPGDPPVILTGGQAFEQAGQAMADLAARLRAVPNCRSQAASVAVLERRWEGLAQALALAGPVFQEAGRVLVGFAFVVDQLQQDTAWSLSRARQALEDATFADRRQERWLADARLAAEAPCERETCLAKARQAAQEAADARDVVRQRGQAVEQATAEWERAARRTMDQIDQAAQIKPLGGSGLALGLTFPPFGEYLTGPGAADFTVFGLLGQLIDRIVDHVKWDLPNRFNLINVPPDILDTDPFDPDHNEQNYVGDCWLISTLNGVMETDAGDQRLRDAIRWGEAEHGYWVTLYVAGQPKEFLVTQVIAEGAAVDGKPGVVSLYEAAVLQAGGFNNLESQMPWVGPAVVDDQATDFHIGTRFMRESGLGIGRLGGSLPGVIGEVLGLVGPMVSDDAIASGGSADGTIAIASTVTPEILGGPNKEVPATRYPSGVTKPVRIAASHAYEVVDIKDGLIGLRNPHGPGNQLDGGGVFYLTPEDFDAIFWEQTNARPG
ncbi:MAG: hypothetical protein LBK42_05100 [Propionibacteriaceae bacterium]|jgi:hypothetical protein|nr:hypothetical protein [Propionibacteriaceae bacterium]